MKLSTTTRRFVCGDCQKAFAKPSLLLRHSTVHNKEKSLFSCTRCLRFFSQNVTLQKHLKDTVCERKSREKNLKQIIKHSVLPVVENSNNLNSIRASIKSRNNVCVYCDRSFLKPSDMERHIRTHTDDRIFNCNETDCGKSFKLKATRDKHSSTHRKQTFLCKICSSNYKSHKVLQNHIRLHSRHQSFPQVLGNTDESSQFRSSSNDFFVIQENEKITDNKSSSLSDLLCDARESSSPYNSSAMEINYIEIEKVLKSVAEIDEQAEAFRQEKSFRKKKLVCETCGKCFNKPIDLRRHTDGVHMKKRPFKCGFLSCDKSFSLKCTLNRHITTHKRVRNLMTCNDFQKFKPISMS